MQHNGLQELQRSIADHQLSKVRNARDVADCDQEVLQRFIRVAGAADAVQHVLDAFNT